MLSSDWFKASNSDSAPLLKSCLHATSNWMRTVSANKMTPNPGCSTCYWNATRLVHSLRSCFLRRTFHLIAEQSCSSTVAGTLRSQVHAHRDISLLHPLQLPPHSWSTVYCFTWSHRHAMPRRPFFVPSAINSLTVAFAENLANRLEVRFSSTLLYCNSVIFFLLPVLVELLLWWY